MVPPEIRFSNRLLVFKSSLGLCSGYWVVVCRCWEYMFFRWDLQWEFTPGASQTWPQLPTLHCRPPMYSCMDVDVLFPCSQYMGNSPNFSTVGVLIHILNVSLLLRRPNLLPHERIYSRMVIIKPRIYPAIPRSSGGKATCRHVIPLLLPTCNNTLCLYRCPAFPELAIMCYKFKYMP